MKLAIFVLKIALTLFIFNVTSIYADGIKLPIDNKYWEFNVKIFKNIAMIAGNSNIGAGGAIFFYEYNGNEWIKQTEIYKGIEFISAPISINNDTAIVGCPNWGIGGAYIYIKNGNEWIEQAEIKANDTTGNNDNYATAVSVYGDIAMLGCPNDNNYKGAVFVFTRNGTIWTQTAKLSESDLSNGRDFGKSVSIYGNNVIIGSQWNAFIYKKVGNNWIQTRVFTSEKPYFGQSVSIFNDTAIVATFTDENVYIYHNDGHSWSFNSKISINDFIKGNYKSSVSIYENIAVIGTTSSDVNRSAAYTFIKNNDKWIFKAKLIGSDVNQGDEFGRKVSVYGNTAIVASKKSVYIFQNVNNLTSGVISGCIYDSDNKPISNVNVNFGKYQELSDESGCYSSLIPYNWTGNVTLSKSYYIFEPPGNSYSNVVKDISNQNYLLNIQTISGYVKDTSGQPVSNVMINTNNDNMKTKTDNKGYYELKVYKGWSGNVKVTANNYHFENPDNHDYSVVTEDIFNQNYIIKVYNISGFIKDIYNNPISGIEIIFNNNGGKTYTNSLGYYNHVVYNNWMGESSAIGKGYRFEPSIRYYSNITQHYADQSFLGTKPTISGFCIDSNNEFIEGIELKIFPGDEKCYTDDIGFYSFDVAYNWSGQIVASKPGYIFNPECIEFKNIISSCGNQNYTATLTQIRITGTIIDENDNPIESVSIKNNDGEEIAITDASGIYEIITNIPVSTTITPTKTSYTFNPSSRNYVNITEEQKEQNYTGFFQNNALIVTPKKLILPSKMGKEIIYVKTDNNQRKWSANLYALSQWISLSRSGNTINVEYSDNDQSNKKYAVILIYSGEIKHVVEVIQEENNENNNKPKEWAVIPSNFRFQGMITAIVQDKNNQIFQSNNDLLAAFVNNECRGVVSPSPISDGKRFFLQVWSNQNIEEMKLKYYDSKNNIIYENIISDIAFEPDMVLGKIEKPHIFIIEYIPDANADGKVDIIDAVEVLKFISNID